MSMMHGHIKSLRAQEAAFKAQAVEVRGDAGASRHDRADTLHAIGEAYGRAATDLQRQVDALLDSITVHAL